MGKRLAAVGMAAAIGVGGLTVAAVNPLGVAGATSTPTSQTAPQQAGKKDHAGKKDNHKNGPLDRALAKLVADGTLTKEQATKVAEALKTEVKAGHEKGKERRQEVLEVAAKAIGSTPEKVAAGLKDGTSLAKQAQAKGVDRKVVADALAKVFNARIDAAVKKGSITAERGAKAKANVAKAVDRILDADGHAKGSHRKDKGHAKGKAGSPRPRKGN